LPCDPGGHLLENALADHLGWLKQRSIHGVLALGSTGEFPLLAVDERRRVLETVARLAAPLPVIANISDIRPVVVAELARFARELRLPGVAVMPPSFFRVSAADQLAFFEFAAEAAQLPVMLYNFPELTGNRIALETMAAFCDRAPMAGIKQSVERVVPRRGRTGARALLPVRELQIREPERGHSCPFENSRFADRSVHAPANSSIRAHPCHPRFVCVSC